MWSWLEICGFIIGEMLSSVKYLVQNIFIKVKLNGGKVLSMM